MHWLAVALSLAVTFFAWYSTKSNVEEKNEERFNTEAEQSVSLLREQIRHYEDALVAGVAAIQANGGSMTAAEWEVFASDLAIEERYPGVNGIGVIVHLGPDEVEDYVDDQRRTRPDFTIKPEHAEAEFLPITYIEPVATNAAAVGLDMAFEGNRYGGIKDARDTGELRITGPIVLVQDSEQTPGFLFFAPWYDIDMPNGESTSVETRRDQFVGAVYSPLVVKELMAGAVATERPLDIRISDGSEVIYDEHQPEFPDFDPNPLFERTIDLDLYGRQWTIDVRSTLSFRDLTSSNEPAFILVGGLILDTLLFIIFLTLSRSNRRATQYADEVTAELVDQSKKLRQSNEELQQFAYVASHDLKTPLRGISDLVEWINEDLEPHLDSNQVPEDVRQNLGRVNEQVRRMNDLITGLLDYSRAGGDDIGGPESISLEAHLDTLRVDLRLDEDQLVYRGPSEVITCGTLPLTQVMANLVTNAVKHHHDPDQLRVVVDCTADNDHLTLIVSDDGPGIEDRFHDRIFDVFQTLGGASSGTGMGLSIVKKMVVRRGGTVHLQSSPGDGTTITVYWPTAATPDLPPVDESAESQLVAVS